MVLTFKNPPSCLCCLCKKLLTYPTHENIYLKNDLYHACSQIVPINLSDIWPTTTKDHVYIWPPQILGLFTFCKWSKRQEKKHVFHGWVIVDNFEILADNVSIFPTELHNSLNNKSSNIFRQEEWSRIEEPCKCLAESTQLCRFQIIYPSQSFTHALLNYYPTVFHNNILTTNTLH